MPQSPAFAPSSLAPIPAFTPVPRARIRHKGWSPERQQAFIEALADTGSVKAAARKVSMTSESAYHLRRQPGAEEFAQAWLAALDHGIARLEDTALDRAINGVAVPIYCYGKIIGTRQVYNDALLMFMLRNRAPSRFTADNPSIATRAHLDRLKRQWRAQWEAEREAQAEIDSEEILESIDAKLDLMRERYLAGKDTFGAPSPEEEDSAEEPDTSG